MVVLHLSSVNCIFCLGSIPAKHWEKKKVLYNKIMEQT